MALTDFTTDGAPIPAGSGVVSKTTTSSLPDWYSNFAKDLLAGAKNVAIQDYVKPPMPRVAGFTPTEIRGMDATVAASTYAAAPIKTGLDAATDLVGKSGLSAAQPYLDAAGKPVYEGISNYMNPYNDAVTNRIAELGARNLTEKILPGLNDQFIRSGQPGSSRNAEMFGRAARDTGDSILAQQNAALQAGYSGALTSAGGDRTRSADLATTAGNLGTAAVTSGLDVAKTITDIGKAGQDAALAGAGALTGVGAAERDMNQKNIDVAVADFLKEQGYPAEKIAELLKTLTGVGETGAVPKTTTEEGIEPLSYNPGFEPSTAANIGGALTGGASVIKALDEAGVFGKK